MADSPNESASEAKAAPLHSSIPVEQNNPDIDSSSIQAPTTDTVRDGGIRINTDDMSPRSSSGDAPSGTPKPTRALTLTLGGLASDRRIRTAFDAAKSTVARGRLAFEQLSSEVKRDERSNIHSALQASQFSILDVYSSDANEVDLAMELRRVESQERRLREHLQTESTARNCCGRLLLRLKQRFITFTTAPAAWIFLVLLGLLAAGVAFLADAPVAALLAARTRTVAANNAFSGYFIWLFWCVGITTIAAAIVHFCPLAEGSGIPQMKSVLAGTTLPQYLSLRVAVFKLLGLVAAQSAGLSIGKEGPFVHISCALANKLSKVPYFASVIGRNEGMRRQLLGAAVAAGVTAVFGTPVGGVLFAVEVTSTYFLTSSYWKCFLCAIVCRFAFDVITALRADDSLSTTKFPGSDLSAEVVAFIALGIICGLIGSGFVYLVNKIRIARSLMMTTPKRRYLIVAVCATLIATATYITPYLRKSDKLVIADLFADEASNPDGQEDMGDWQSPTVLFSLAVFICIKLAVTVISISLPIACGLFIPLFVIGAAVGRFVGESLALTFPSVTPGAYAVVGAAALTSGATQTVSAAVIVFELTGQTSHLLPVLLATLVAYSVSGVFTVGIYDMLLMLSGLPYLPRVYHSGTYNLCAEHIMCKDFRLLTHTSTYRDALRLLAETNELTAGNLPGFYAQQAQEIPVVDSQASMELRGSVARASLEKIFRYHFARLQTTNPTHDNSAAASTMASTVGFINRALIASPNHVQEEDSYADMAITSPSTHQPMSTRIASAFGFGQLDREPAIDAALLEESFPSEWLDTVISYHQLDSPPSDNTTLPLRVDEAPFQISEHTPLPKVHYLFAICLFSHLYVTHAGKLRGIIRKDDLAKADLPDISGQHHNQSDDRTSLLAAVHT